MTDKPPRPATISAFGAVGMVVCCGLPLLLAAGTGVTVAGVGVRSGLLVAAGMIAAIAGLFVWRDRRRAGCSLVGASVDD